jgi:hypothetical protein
MIESLTPLIQTFTLIMQFVVLVAIGLNFRTMWQTFKAINQSSELIGLFRSEIAYLTMRIEVLEGRQTGGPIEQEGFRGRSRPN